MERAAGGATRASTRRASRAWSGIGRRFAAVVFAAVVPAAAVSRKPKPSGPEALKAEGRVERVEPSRLTIVEANGYELMLRAFQDYREKVAPGSEVTAWYVPQPDGSFALKSLDYPEENFFASAAEIRERVHKIVVLPSSDVGDASALYDTIGQFLNARLGWYAGSWRLASELDRRATQASSTLDAFDPKTGRFNLSAYTRGHAALIPAICSQAHVDAVLVVNLESASAHVRRLVAYWDGNEEPVAGPGMRAVAKLSFFPDKGNVAASTASLELRDAKGKLLWRNRRGLALLVRLEGGATNKLRDRPLSEFLGATSRVQAWLNAVFTGLTP